MVSAVTDSSFVVEFAKCFALRVWRRQAARRWPKYSRVKAMKAPLIAMAVVVASYFNSPRHLLKVSFPETGVTCGKGYLLVGEHEICVCQKLGRCQF